MPIEPAAKGGGNVGGLVFWGIAKTDNDGNASGINVTPAAGMRLYKTGSVIVLVNSGHVIAEYHGGGFSVSCPGIINLCTLVLEICRLRKM